jgi:hypothetical protein
MAITPDILDDVIFCPHCDFSCNRQLHLTKHIRATHSRLERWLNTKHAENNGDKLKKHVCDQVIIVDKLV